MRTLSWHKTHLGQIDQRATKVVPNTYVRAFAETAGGGDEKPERVKVYLTYEQVLKRLLARVWYGNKHLRVAKLDFIATYKDYHVSEDWPAPLLGPEDKDTCYVLDADGYEPSEWLRVSATGLSTIVRDHGFGIDVAMSGVADVKLGPKANKQRTFQTEVSAEVDPDLHCYALTPNADGKNLDLGTYLGEYLGATQMYLEKLGPSPVDLWKPFVDMYGSWLNLERGSDPASIEVRPERIFLRGGDSLDLDVDIKPRKPGHMMFAICTEIVNAERPVRSVSDLIGITVDAELNIRRDF